MTPLVRMARREDLDGLMALAAITGGGMTNLPHDGEALTQKIEWSERSCGVPIAMPADEFYLLVLEDRDSGRVLGTGSLYSRLGARWPFYSYKLGRVTQRSCELDRTFSTELLHVVNDFDGASEVGGLFLHPDARSGGLGQMLARSRYLFIARHRERFGDKVVAELRGWTEGGRSPFWEAVCQPFFAGDFAAADFHNALHGNRFIADLMPRYPIYVSMLPKSAQGAIGRPHPHSVPAKVMLENEGFYYDGYVDVFDAGPTLCIRTDQIATLRNLQMCGTLSLVGGLCAEGYGQEFRVEKR